MFLKIDCMFFTRRYYGEELKNTIEALHHIAVRLQKEDTIEGSV